MKFKFFLIALSLFVGGPVLADIHPADIAAAQTGTQSLNLKINEMMVFLNAVQDLSNHNWTVTHVVAGITVTTTIDAQTQALLVARYDSLKQELVAIFATLP